ncbi:hypothetical protein D3C86_1789540 [compost metagenome]
MDAFQVKVTVLSVFTDTARFDGAVGLVTTRGSVSDHVLPSYHPVAVLVKPAWF